LEGFTGGAWIAEFAALSEPALVVKTVASALRVSEQPGRPLMDVMVDHLSSKSLLLILDNCEHVLSACAQLAGTLLRACPNLRILVTSRERLGIAGEVTYRVPALSLPDPQNSPDGQNMTRYEAIRLFKERAGSCDPGFTLAAGNGSAVAQVCRRLDGIPLAIELAAARAKVLTPQEIAERLDDQFRLLRGGPRDAPTRHRSLHATISWSYELLSAGEQHLFRRLAVFRGGFTLESAEAVCGGDDGDVLDGLSSLIDKSLLTRIVTPAGAARFNILETFREYGVERLAAEGELDGTRSGTRSTSRRCASSRIPR
jgi:predicted ATPase